MMTMIAMIFPMVFTSFLSFYGLGKERRWGTNWGLAEQKQTAAHVILREQSD